ncbi:MAG: hypothetical protein KTR24_02125 [Saprospiraceae bacterium]|nr:hypothetical protein [Saprospiraceae bacterium]
MYKLFTKHGQLFAFGIALLVIVLFLVQVLGGIDGFNGLAKEDRGSTTIFDMGLQLTIGLLIICAVVAVLFGIYQMVTNPKAAIKGIAALVILGVLFFALYSSSEAETTGIVGNAAEEFKVSDGSSKIISAGLKSTLILAGLAAAAFVVSEVRNFFK